MEAQVIIGRVAIIGLVAAAVILLAPAAPADVADDHESVELRLKPLPDGVKRTRIVNAEDGSMWVVVTMVDGREERLTPDEFIARIDRDTRKRRLLYRILNITSPVGIAWIVLGLLGQVVFAGRMILQWIVSEKEKRSVVPVAFWWMSLLGASMLLVYFVWRRDIVGVLGQSTGWVIYCRNLLLIYRESRGG
jgi:lipid-A-disaccharide synthase-like uncharacterized protein